MKGKSPLNHLVLPGININSLSVLSDNTAETNTLETFWNAKEFNLSRGLDYNPDKKPYNNTNSVCAKHLDHKNFTYTIQVVSGILYVYLQFKYNT